MYYIHQSFYSRLFGKGIVLILSLAQIIAKATFLKKKKNAWLSVLVISKCFLVVFN